MAVSQATADKIKSLEQAHKAQFVDLVLANHTWIKLLPKIQKLAKTDKKYVSMMNLAHTIAKNAAQWYVRQIQYEQRAGVPKSDKDILKYFLQPANEKKLVQQAAQFISPVSKDKLSLSGQQIYSMCGVAFFDMIDKYKQEN